MSTVENNITTRCEFLIRSTNYSR